MADEKILKEDDEELVVREVEKLPAPGEKAEDDDRIKEEEEDEDDEDEKLADSQDDEESEVISAKRKRRHKRREMQRRAREQQQRELRILREENMTLTQRMAALEGHSINTTEHTIEQRLREALNEAQQAEHIMARAIEAGNGTDVATALRIRDDAREKAKQLSAAGQEIQQHKQRVNQPAPNPRVTSLAQEWIAANPWYDPNGRDEESRITKAIDDGLIRDGYDPAQADYWQELTGRVSRRLNGSAERGEEKRRKVVPSGSGREYASDATRKEVSVTPERKAAMVEAGVWDDPKLRNRYLKSYQKYDRQSN